MFIVNVLTEEQRADMYLDWFNNYLTVEVFAVHYGLSEDAAFRILDIGRADHEARVNKEG